MVKFGKYIEIKNLTKSLSFGVSYVLMDYDYTGSNSFFGADGTPIKSYR